MAGVIFNAYEDTEEVAITENTEVVKDTKDTENTEDTEDVEDAEGVEDAEDEDSDEDDEVDVPTIDITSELKEIKEALKKPEDLSESAPVPDVPFFQGSEEELESLVTDPKAFNNFLEGYAKKVTQRTAMQLAAGFAKNLPSLIESQIKATTSTQNTIQGFFKSNPHLATKEMKGVIEGSIKNAVNSGASLPDALKSIEKAFKGTVKNTPVKKVKPRKKTKTTPTKRVKVAKDKESPAQNFMANLLANG